MQRKSLRKANHDLGGALLYLGEAVKEDVSGQVAVKLRPEEFFLSYVPLPL